MTEQHPYNGCCGSYGIIRQMAAPVTVMAPLLVWQVTGAECCNLEVLILSVVIYLAPSAVTGGRGSVDGEDRTRNGENRCHGFNH